MLGAIIIGGVLVWQFGHVSIKSNVPVCTQEARICPDGSSVSRTGPNCEFVECPREHQILTTNWQVYRNEDYNFEIKYPTYYMFGEFKSGDGYVINFSNKQYTEDLSGGCILDISIDPNPLKKSPEKWFADNSTKAEFGTDAYEKSGKGYYNSNQAKPEKIIINGENALKFYQIGGYPSDSIKILVEDNIYLMEINYFTSCSSEIKTFDQIISTLKIIP